MSASPPFQVDLDSRHPQRQSDIERCTLGRLVVQPIDGNIFALKLILVIVSDKVGCFGPSRSRLGTLSVRL